MLPLIRFFIFNVALSTTDVGTDLSTFLELLRDNPLWALLTLTWTIMPFIVHTMFFLYKKVTGKLPTSATYWELIKDFYNEAGMHLPFVSSIHNLWRTKRLYGLKYGTDKFKMRDHKEVEKILDEAGRCSQGESTYEAGPQSVTQVN